MTFSTHVVSEPKGGGLKTGSGGPKKQFASSAQEPAMPPQAASFAQAGVALLLMQCVPGPAPFVQSFCEVPSLATRVVPPTTLKMLVASSGILPGGTTVPLPPPKYRQPSPRLRRLAVQAVSVVSSPEKGGAPSAVRPAGPQLVLPAVVVNESVAIVVVVVLKVVVVVVVLVVGHWQFASQISPGPNAPHGLPGGSQSSPGSTVPLPQSGLVVVVVLVVVVAVTVVVEPSVVVVVGVAGFFSDGTQRSIARRTVSRRSALN
jgi:hypothetical protein